MYLVTNDLICFDIGINGSLSPPGESMSIVIEKRLSELQEEHDKVKSTWVDPELYEKVKKQLETESEAKKTIEVILGRSFKVSLYNLV